MVKLRTRICLILICLFQEDECPKTSNNSRVTEKSIKLQSVGACLYAEKLLVEKAYALPILFDHVWLHFQWGQLKTA